MTISAAESRRKWRENNSEKVKADNKQWRKENPEKVNANHKKWRDENPKRNAYNDQRKNAKRRGIEFLLTFEEWCAMWELQWDNRGCGINDMQMCRTGDSGPYSVQNCRIDTRRNNIDEYLSPQQEESDE